MSYPNNCAMPKEPRPSVQYSRVTLRRSTKLPDDECTRLKDQYLKVFSDVLALELNMMDALSAQEFMDVWNLVMPAFNYLTGIARCSDGPSAMPACPPTMSDKVYLWAEQWYAIRTPYQHFQRRYPDLCTEAFFEYERQHGRRNRQFEKLCGVGR